MPSLLDPRYLKPLKYVTVLENRSTKGNPLEPPKLATWLLEQFSPVLQNTPLVGDLVESYKQGRSAGWYWRQVLWAVVVGFLNLFRKQWGRLAYAVVCSSLISISWFSMFPMTGRTSVYAVAVTCDGHMERHVWHSPVEEVGPASTLPAVFALYAKSYAIQWPWSLVYQMAFLSVFQAILVAFALCAYHGFARILKAQNFLRALLVVVVILASSNVAGTFLAVPLGRILRLIPIPELLGWMLTSTPTIIALLIGMGKADSGTTAKAMSAA